MPTLPTPTTLRAKSVEPELLEQHAPVVLQRGAVGAQQLVQAVEHFIAFGALARSSIGTISGGSATIRASPSTTCVSLEKADMLSLVRALASAFSVRLTCLGLSCEPSSLSVVSMSRWAYQTSRFFIAAKPAIAVRYSSTVSSTICSWSLTGKPLSRAAISMLAARRLTSHSHGPGSVSSKSLTSNTSRRSGEANTPKFDRCASPQHCTVSPERGVAARSLAMISAAPR